jgi:hypothetical protein
MSMLIKASNKMAYGKVGIIWGGRLGEIEDGSRDRNRADQGAQAR